LVWPTKGEFDAFDFGKDMLFRLNWAVSHFSGKYKLVEGQTFRGVFPRLLGKAKHYM
jgi:hypothetical protein